MVFVTTFKHDALAGPVAVPTCAVHQPVVVANEIARLKPAWSAPAKH
jgi:hypothetical protein